MDQRFAGRTCIIATMHHKEAVIAPLLVAGLGVEVRVPPDFDTDRFGTFTRDRERPGNQLETAKQKAGSALDLTGADLGIASEGSFFPHPALPLMACNREIVLLTDRLHSLTVWGESISLETNFRSQTVHNWDEVVAFAQKVGFPDHGLVVMPNSKATEGICKGIRDWDTLAATVKKFFIHSAPIHIETDMRAFHNPTRLRNIARATEDLLEKLQSLCPQCGTPGFAVIEYLGGLPCEWCGLPTSQTRATILGCAVCSLRQERPGEKTSADPTFCSFCNP